MPYVFEIAPWLIAQYEINGEVRLSKEMADVLGTKTAKVISRCGKRYKQIIEISWVDIDGLSRRDWINQHDLQMFSGKEVYAAFKQGVPFDNWR